MKRTRSQTLAAWLVLSYLAVILLGLGGGALLSWLAVERLYLGTQGANLLAQAQLAAAALTVQAPLAAVAEPYAQTANALPGIHTRLLDAQGAVLIGLSGTGTGLLPGTGELALPEQALVQPGTAGETQGVVTPAELLSRPEIAQALQGEAATAVRRVPDAAGQRVLYAAAPVFDVDEQRRPAVVQIVYLAMPLPDTQWSALPAAVRWQFAAALLAAAGLAAALGLLLAQRISRPLAELARAAHIVAGGDLAQTAPVEAGITELAVLGHAFNRMTGSLRQADQAKTAFISDVSHELRTPLTVIKGTIETLQDGALDDLAARDSFLASMSRETARLIRLVNDLLVLTRADAGALNLQLQAVDLAEAARARCAHLETTAAQRGVRLSVLAEPQVDGSAGCTVLADPDRLAQVLDNLLDNALRYSPQGGEVRIGVNPEPGRVICRVQDAGPGIPPEHLPLIFERFYRADPARWRGQGGSGLGLAIVRGLVLAQGGGVEVSSQPGQGAVLTFWLPAEKSVYP